MKIYLNMNFIIFNIVILVYYKLHFFLDFNWKNYKSLKLILSLIY